MVNKIKIGTRVPLVKNLLIVEGITRAGKFLLANLIHGFKDIEPIQYYGLPENLSFLEKFGFINRRAAKEILQCQIDTHCYEMLIGRNFNHRKFDKSSIYNNPRYKEFLTRSNEPDREKLLAAFYKNNSYSFFIMHELMPHIKIYLDTFSDIKIVSIQRSPIELVHSWYKCGLGKRWGNDPTWFQIALGDNQGPIPWYAHDWTHDYRTLPEIDRVIHSIQTLDYLYKKSFSRLSSRDKNKILFVRYEKILSSPLKVIDSIKKFLNKNTLPEIGKILKKEKLPVKNYGAQILNKIKIIKKMASEKYFKILMDLENEYNL